MNKKPVAPRLMIVGCLLLIAVVLVNGHPVLPEQPEAAQVETRCGWLDNPTPANISLYDREAEWIISVQGQYEAKGDWSLPDYKPGQWVATNAGSYGYGCACLRLRADRQTRKVLEVMNASARPLSVCRRDRSLRRWKSMFK